MPNYSSIKQLVIDETITNGGLPTFERLTELVKENFPNSDFFIVIAKNSIVSLE